MTMLWLTTGALVGLVCLLYFADKVVNYSVMIAHVLGMSPAVIGLTIVAIGTSLPELAIATVSAQTGLSSMAFGNIIGSNIANVGLVLGITTLVAPLVVRDTSILKHINILIVITGLFVLTLIDQSISQVEGILLLITLLATVTYQIKSREPVNIQKERKVARLQQFSLWVKFALSLCFIYLFSRIFIYCISEIAIIFGISELIIALTVIAVGTSLPELVTAIVASMKKQNELALGNIIGSNLFNLLGGIGLASTITPIQIDMQNILRDYGIMVLFLLLLLVPFLLKVFKIQKTITFTRPFGLFLFSIYITYFIILL